MLILSDINYEPEPELEFRAPGLVIILLCILAWAATIGVFFAAFRGFRGDFWRMNRFNSNTVEPDDSVALGMAAE